MYSIHCIVFVMRYKLSVQVNSIKCVGGIVIVLLLVFSLLLLLFLVFFGGAGVWTIIQCLMF